MSLFHYLRIARRSLPDKSEQRLDEIRRRRLLALFQLGHQAILQLGKVSVEETSSFRNSARDGKKFNSKNSLALLRSDDQLRDRCSRHGGHIDVLDVPGEGAVHAPDEVVLLLGEALRSLLGDEDCGRKVVVTNLWIFKTVRCSSLRAIWSPSLWHTKFSRFLNTSRP